MVVGRANEWIVGKIFKNWMCRMLYYQSRNLHRSILQHNAPVSQCLTWPNALRVAVVIDDSFCLDACALHTDAFNYNIKIIIHVVLQTVKHVYAHIINDFQIFTDKFTRKWFLVHYIFLWINYVWISSMQFFFILTA